MFTTRKLLSAVAAAAALLTLATPAHAVTVFSEDFSTAVGDYRGFPYGAGYGLGDDILGTQLMVTNGNVDVVGIPAGAPWGCGWSAAGNCLDLQGFHGSLLGAVASKSTFNIVAGTTYTFSFGAGVGNVGTGTSDFDLTFGSFAHRFTAGLTREFYTLDWTASADESGVRLGFASASIAGLANGAILDNILVTSVAGAPVVPAPIPEPGTYALMLAGLAGVGFVARRRSASAAQKR